MKRSKDISELSDQKMGKTPSKHIADVEKPLII